jgi:3-phosphoshikimate 1-carboxyvinyltransferase
LDAGRLRIKESDRLAAMADCLGRLGAVVDEHEEELIVTGGTLKGGCEVSGYNDHRIVMSMAVAALICEEPLIIRGAEAVSKSYPDFFEEYVRLGGRADVVTDR